MENIIVVGTGDLYGRFLAPSLHGMQQQNITKLVATCDILDKKEDPYFGDTPHIIREDPSQSLSDVLSEFKPLNPIVILGHANNYHFMDLKDLINAGFRVMLEKPYATDSVQLAAMENLIRQNPGKIALIDYYLMRKSIPALIFGGLVNQDSFYFNNEEVITSNKSFANSRNLSGKIKEMIGDPISVELKILEGYGEQGTLDHRGAHLYDSRLGGGMIQDLGLHALITLFMLRDYLGRLDFKKEPKIRLAQSQEYLNEASKTHNIPEHYVAESYAEIETSTSIDIPVKITVGKYVQDNPDQKKLVIRGSKGEFYLDLVENAVTLYSEDKSQEGKIMELVNKKKDRYYPVIRSGIEILNNSSPFGVDTNEILLEVQKVVLSIIGNSHKLNAIKIYESGKPYYEIFTQDSVQSDRLSRFNTRDFESYFREYSNYLHETLLKVDTKVLDRIVNVLLEARKNGKTIYFIGNGGSAATASHFMEDMGEIGRKLGIKVFNSISLTDNVAFITAAANDHGYDKIFSFQMQGSFQKGDILVAISASGNSPNIIEAVKFAKDKGGIVIGLVGFDGGKLLQMSDYTFHIKTSKGEYGPVEDSHMIFDHILTSYLYYHLKQELEN